MKDQLGYDLEIGVYYRVFIRKYGGKQLILTGKAVKITEDKVTFDDVLYQYISLNDLGKAHYSEIFISEKRKVVKTNREFYWLHKECFDEDYLKVKK